MRIAGLALASERRFGVRRRAGLVPRGPEAPHPGVDVGSLSQGTDELGDVHAGASVDLGRVLLAQDIDAHVAEPTRGQGLAASLVRH